MELRHAMKFVNKLNFVMNFSLRIPIIIIVYYINWDVLTMPVPIGHYILKENAVNLMYMKN